MTKKKYDSTIEKFQDKIQKVEGSTCWEWRGSFNSAKYGNIYVIETKKTIGVHRYAYEAFHGTEPGEVILHTCDNRKCCNPLHLKSGTQTDNMRDASSKNRLPQGETSYLSKLTEAEVYTIRNQEGIQTTKELSDLFNVLPKTIRRIQKRETWKHLG